MVSSSIPIKEQSVFVCWFVCWSAFYRPHDICPPCGAASEWPREQEPPSRAARTPGQACTCESTRVMYTHHYIYTYKRVVCVCLLVCLSSFYRPHDICPLCGAASEWPRAGSAVVASGPARAGKRMYGESTCAHAVQLLNEKIGALMPFKNKTVRARMLSYTYR